MRNIIFRGKRIDNSKMVYGDLIHTEQGVLIIEKMKDTGYKITIEKAFDIDADTIGQYTNLKDKSGNRIFENDEVYVCRGVDIEKGVVYFDERIAAFAVRFEQKEFALLFDIVLAQQEDTRVYIEVIGNV